MIFKIKINNKKIFIQNNNIYNIKIVEIICEKVKFNFNYYLVNKLR